jgi:hypothetical protein
MHTVTFILLLLVHLMLGVLAPAITHCTGVCYPFTMLSLPIVPLSLHFHQLCHNVAIILSRCAQRAGSQGGLGASRRRIRREADGKVCAVPLSAMP